MPSNAFSFRKRRRPSRLAARKRKKAIGYGVLSVLTALFLVGLVVYLSHREEILISDIRISGNAQVSTQALVAKTQEMLSGNYFGIFPKRNSFLFRNSTLASYLMGIFPAIDLIEIKKSSFSHLDIVVQERIPVAFWCNSGSIQSIEFPPCYFLDKTGLLFSEATTSSPGNFLKFLSNPQVPLVLKDFLFPSDHFKEMLFLLQALENLGLHTQEVLIEKRAGNIEDYTLLFSSGIKIFVSGNRNLEESLEDITAFFTDPNVLSDKGVLKEIHYVDFRFKNKIYYK